MKIIFEKNSSVTFRIWIFYSENYSDTSYSRKTVMRNQKIMKFMKSSILMFILPTIKLLTNDSSLLPDRRFQRSKEIIFFLAICYWIYMCNMIFCFRCLFYYNYSFLDLMDSFSIQFRFQNDRLIRVHVFISFLYFFLS